MKNLKEVLNNVKSFNKKEKCQKWLNVKKCIKSKNVKNVRNVKN